MGSSDNTVNWVVVLMAASSLLSMICMLQVDKIVHSDLYRFGLQFSYDWATPYWTLTKAIFLVGWINIIAAVGVQLYNARFKRKEVEQLVSEVKDEVMKTEIEPTRAQDQKRTLEGDMKQSNQPMFAVDLSTHVRVHEGDGGFPCPSCGVMISPEDESETIYTIIDTKTKGESLEELTIQCNKCGSRIRVRPRQEPNASETENTEDQQKEIQAPSESPDTIQEKTEQKQDLVEDTSNKVQVELRQLGATEEEAPPAT